MSKLDQSARELKSAVAEFEVTNAALMGAIEKKHSDKPTTATNATAAATGGQFVVNDKPFNDVLANYERV